MFNCVFVSILILIIYSLSIWSLKSRKKGVVNKSRSHAALASAAISAAATSSAMSNILSRLHKKKFLN